MRSWWLQIGGHRTHAVVSTEPCSSDLPVICVPGLGMSGRYFLPTAESLIGRWPLYVPDSPGWGRSEGPPRALDVPELADALARWMAAAGIARAALIGNSLGAQVIVDLAVRYPA